MVAVAHKIDPEPDTVITLKNPCIRFAPWTSGEIAEDDPVESRSLSNDGRNTVQDKDDEVQATGVETLSDSGDPESTVSLSGGTISSHIMHFDTSSAFAEPVQDDVLYYVSSRHLMLASPVFKKTLQSGGFKESIPNGKDGLYHITAHNWDSEAFFIVMQIVHGRNKQAPRKITLELLAKIAVIEDYYLFGETLEIFKDLWFQHIKQNCVPTTHCRDLVLWIWATWVFNDREQFEKATIVAIKHSTDAVSALGLPLPQRVTDNLEHERYYAISNIFLGLHRLLEGYESKSYTCPYDASQSFLCGSFLLGALRKGMNEANILHPWPTIPFSGLSVEELCIRLKCIKSPAWLSWTSHTTHTCNLEDVMATLVANALATIEGLCLASLKLNGE